MIVAGYIRCRWVHSRAPGGQGFIRGHWVRSCPASRCIHQRSLGSLGYALGVDGFILGSCDHSGDYWKSLGSPGLVGFTRALSSGG